MSEDTSYTKALSQSAQETAFEKFPRFQESFSNAAEVFEEFITNPFFNQLGGAPAITLAGAFFMARALDDKDVPIDKVLDIFAHHQAHQQMPNTVAENHFFKRPFLMLCDHEAQKLIPNSLPSSGTNHHPKAAYR